MAAPFGSFPYDAAGIDLHSHPLFIPAMRAPSTQDLYPAGTQWMDGSVSPKIIYQTTGGGVWIADATINPTFTTLTVTGLSTLGALTQVGTTNINASGSAVTTIGTGGTGAVNIGNATGNTVVTGSLRTTTTLTATLGNITATNGNLVLGTAGNKLNITTGANASVGVSAALDGASPSQLVVATTAVTASSLIFLSYATAGGTQGSLSIGTVVAGTSFQIKSSANGDTSTVNWLIIN